MTAHVDESALPATHGSLAVAGVKAREQLANLHIALETRTGILMTQHKITRNDAFNLLRLSSQHQLR
jgi:AmiR/NasT family two-component response regulator